MEDESFIQAENQVNKYHYQLAPESMIPVLTKQGYSLDPSLRQLSRMNEEQLKKVENFTIRNEFATVRFEGLTDVRNLNIDKIANFSFKSVKKNLKTCKIYLKKIGGIISRRGLHRGKQALQGQGIK